MEDNDDYTNYWETNRFLQIEELRYFDGVTPSYCNFNDSIVLDQSSLASTNIDMLPKDNLSNTSSPKKSITTLPLSPINSESMENIEDGIKYWELDMLLSNFDGAVPSNDSSSPDGTQSSGLASKNINSERNRRNKLNDRLYALRALVPNITKMDKASTVKDAIKYIQWLQDEERRIQSELCELENPIVLELDQDVTASCSKPKRQRVEHRHDSDASRLVSSPIEVLDLRVSNMGDKTLVVSLTCSKRRDTILKLCEVFESLKLKTITTNITAFSGKILKTVFMEGDEKDVLRQQIESAIAAINDL